MTIPAPPSDATYDVERLIGENGCAYLVWKGTVYTLRVTRNGKLILTK